MYGNFDWVPAFLLPVRTELIKCWIYTPTRSTTLYHCCVVLPACDMQAAYTRYVIELVVGMV